MEPSPQPQGIFPVETAAQGECLETTVKRLAALGSFDCDKRFCESLAFAPDDRVEVRSESDNGLSSNPRRLSHDERQNPRSSKTGSDGAPSAQDDRVEAGSRLAEVEQTADVSAALSARAATNGSE